MSKLKIIGKLLKIFVSGTPCGIAVVYVPNRNESRVEFLTFAHVISHGYLGKLIHEGFARTSKKKKKA